ncbi:MAG: hypothetical protein WBS17_19185 [Candidatus Acidiferrales bacterium]
MTPNSKTTEKTMATAVARWLKSERGLAAQEISLGRNRFDVVAYDKKRRVFKVVECKLTTRESGIGKTFGQLASYTAGLSNRGYEFVNAASKNLKNISFNTWMEATSGGRTIQVEYFVALREKALKDVEFLRSVRKQVPGVGIIRYKENGQCKDNIWSHGKRDYELCCAKPRKIKLNQPRRRYS